MKAVIISHARVTAIDSDPFDQFTYLLYGNDGLLHEDVVTLRTPRVFAAELEGSSAFMMMMTAIASSKRANYVSLVGRTFLD